MSHQNLKNKLQEFCQLNNIIYPKYSSIQMGEAHNPLFISKVCVNDIISTGKTHPTKKKAEFSAAEEAYKLVSFSKEEETFEKVENEKIELDGNHYLYIDLENVGDCGKVIEKIAHIKGLEIVGCVGKLHQYSSKKTMFNNGMRIEVIPTAHKDGCDIGMAILLTMLYVDLDSTDTIILLSRDHWGAAWTECANNGLLKRTGFNEPKILHFTNSEELKQYFLK